MNNIRTIKIFSKEVVAGKQKFITSNANIADKWYKIKFTKGCEGAPKERGMYELTIDLADTSFQRGETYTNKQGEVTKANDIIWVHKITEIRNYTEEGLRENRAIIMKPIFDGE